LSHVGVPVSGFFVAALNRSCCFFTVTRAGFSFFFFFLFFDYHQSSAITVYPRKTDMDWMKRAIPAHA